MYRIRKCEICNASYNYIQTGTGIYLNVLKFIPDLNAFDGRVCLINE